MTWTLARRLQVSGLAAMLAGAASGCPATEAEADADLDAARSRRDVAEYFFDTNLDAIIPILPDSGRPDAPFIDAAPDGGPILGCMGTSTPPEPCIDDSECRARGRARCNVVIHAVSACPVPCIPSSPECATDADCGGARPFCNHYQPQCACPRHVCEAERLPRCTDGFACPDNSTCAPEEPRADEHGCAPKPCRTTADCDCGFCTLRGMCANGAGTCE
jgi:hypothetical protein